MIESILKSFEVWTDAQGIKSKGRVKSIDNISFEGISRLRDLVLDLAIRGKLVFQNGDDDSASILLEKSETEKDKLIEQGKIKKHKQLEEITENNFPFELPNGWQWAWFADAYFFQEGPGIRNWQFRTKGIKLLNVQNIVNNKLILDNTDKYIDEKEYTEKYLHFTIEENDLLFASSGGSWGKSAFFSDPGYKVIVNTSTIRIHPYVQDSSKNYLKYFLDSSFFKQQMIAQLVGMQPNFGSTHLLKILVPIPPSAEQFRIAEKVEELISVCDKLEEEKANNLKTHQYLVDCLLETLTNAANADELHSAWEKISEQFETLFCTDESIDQLKETILQLAVMGKLTKQNPKDESASLLLERINDIKQKLIEDELIRKENKLTDVPVVEQPFVLPENWSWVRLGTITNKIGSGSTPKGGKEVYSENGILFLRSQNIRNEGLLLDDVVYIDKITNEKMSNSIVMLNDILLNITGGSLGRSTIFLDAEKKANVSQHVTIIRPTLEESSPYLHLCILSPYVQNLIWGRQVGANREGLSKKILEQFEIPYPPLLEQKRIVEKVKELFSFCDSLKRKIEKANEINLSLSQTVLDFI
ncbi:restriction endonuclease subunit S [Asinibacterium sp. OR53]|uniref:restriction endonuclease subunit S n=1 Tax=Asinibacterium sp. OR53 TaxID=925409 RepID=UPI00047C2F14|nr:restriction endonuclease subunit S [Asinibacterium sp. OR53]